MKLKSVFIVKSCMKELLGKDLTLKVFIQNSSLRAYRSILSLKII